MPPKQENFTGVSAGNNAQHGPAPGVTIDTNVTSSNWWRLRDVRIASAPESALLHNQAILREGIDSLKADVKSLQSSATPLTFIDGNLEIGVRDILESLKANVLCLQEKIKELNVPKSIKHDNASTVLADSTETTDMPQQYLEQMRSTAVDEIMHQFSEDLWLCYGTFVKIEGETWMEHVVDFKRDAEKFYDHVLSASGLQSQNSKLSSHLASLDDWSRLGLYVASTMKFLRQGGQAKSPTESTENEPSDG